MPIPRFLTWCLALLVMLCTGWPARAGQGWAAGPELEQAVLVLRAFGLVRGDRDGNLRLQETITRAEMVKVLVAGAGLTPQTRGASGFADVPESFWAANYIGAARTAGLAGGYEDGTFRPQRPVTVAEVVKLAGAVAGVSPDGTDWPGAWLRANARAGVVPAGADLAADSGRPATRAEAFVLVHRAFGQVPGPGGRTVYQRVHDGVPPALTLSAAAAGADLVVTGTVRDNGPCCAVLTAAGRAVQPDAAGAFRLVLARDAAPERVVAVARDHAGNAAEAQAQVPPARPDRLEAPTALQVRAGAPAPVAVRVLDAAGRPVSGVEVSGQSDLGTWDAAALQFQPRGGAGRGHLTLSAPGVAPVRIAVEVLPGPPAALAVEGPRFPPRGHPVQYEVTGAEDAFRNAVAGPAAELLWAVEPADAAQVAAGGTFTFLRSGDFTVVARSGGAEGRWPVHVSGPLAGVRVVGPAELVANGVTEHELQVQMVDASGAVVPGYDGSAELGELPGGVVLAHVDPAVKEGVRRYRVRVEGSPRPLAFTPRAEDRTTAVQAAYVTGKAEFAAVAPAAAGVRLVPAGQYLNRAGGTLALDVMVVDQADAPLRNSTRAVQLAVSGPATLSSTAVTYDGRTGARVVLQATGGTGPVTVTAKAHGLPEAAATVTARDVGAPARLVLTSPMAGKFINPLAPAPHNSAEVQVQVTDANGIPVGGPAQVTLRMERASDGVTLSGRPLAQPVTVALDPATGTGSFRVEVVRYGGEILLVAGAGGLTEAQLALYAAIRAPGGGDPAAQAGFLAPRELRAQPGKAVMVRLQVLDAGGLGTSNPAGHTVELAADSGLTVDGGSGTITALPSKYGIADLVLAAAQPGTYHLRISGGKLRPAAGMETVTLVVAP